LDRQVGMSVTVEYGTQAEAGKEKLTAPGAEASCGRASVHSRGAQAVRHRAAGDAAVDVEAKRARFTRRNRAALRRVTEQLVTVGQTCHGGAKVQRLCRVVCHVDVQVIRLTGPWVRGTQPRLISVIVAGGVDRVPRAEHETCRRSQADNI